MKYLLTAAFLLLAFMPLLAAEDTIAYGTAFVIDAGGFLITCAHVVDYADEVSVTLGGKTYAASVLSIDDRHDLALLQIQATNLSCLPLANSNAVQLGEEVRACGYPLAGTIGKDIKVTRGTISGISNYRTQKTFQVDAPINPGNSGGPLINEKGEVIGIVNAKITDPDVENIGFAVPINYIKSMLNTEDISFVNGTATAKPDGPTLVKNVVPAIALVTAKYPAVDTADDGIIRAKGFELVDDQGKLLGALKIDNEDSQPVLWLTSKEATSGLLLHASDTMGAGLTFLRGDQVTAWFFTDKAGNTSLNLYAADGKKGLFSIEAEKDGKTRIHIAGKDGKGSVVVVCPVGEKPFLAITDKNDKIIWSAP